MELDKELQIAFNYIKDETTRLIDQILTTEKATREEWEIANKLLEVYSKPIREKWAFGRLLEKGEAE